jgi:mRNA-degrading endonuclease toxin of MazEF toxin-antitoxin module
VAQKRSPQNRRGNVTVHANAGVTLAATASDGPRYLPVAVELEPTGTTSAT